MSQTLQSIESSQSTGSSESSQEENFTPFSGVLLDKSPFESEISLVSDEKSRDVTNTPSLIKEEIETIEAGCQTDVSGRYSSDLGSRKSFRLLERRRLSSLKRKIEESPENSQKRIKP